MGIDERGAWSIEGPTTRERRRACTRQAGRMGSVSDVDGQSMPRTSFRLVMLGMPR